MTLYDRIKALCAQKGISVRELEKQMGFSYGSVAKWKNHAPSFDKIVKIADFFGVPNEALTGDIKDNQLLWLTPDDSAILFQYRRLNEIGRQKVREYITDLIGQYAE